MYIVKMSITHEKICRLCFRVVTNEFSEIDEVMRQMFDLLLLKLEMNRIRDPIICPDCVEIAKKCLKFKLTFLCTERNILLFSADMENAKHNIKTIYKENEYVQIVDEHLAICRICMARLERNNSVSLDSLRHEKLLFEMISGYLPEMDLNIIENPTICTTCRRNLKCVFKFVQNCIDTEEKIKSFCKEQATDRKDQVNVGNVLNILSKDILERPEKNLQRCTKGELYILEDSECVYPETYSGLIKLEELDIKEEEIHLEGTSHKSLPEIRLDMLDKVTSNKTHKCPLCAYESKQKKNLRRHMFIHKDVSEIKMHKCPLCAHETRHKSNLGKHMLVHKETTNIKMHKCSLCTYEYKYKCNLKRHMLIHKDVSEIKMRKCSLCTNEYKHTGNLKRHMLLHKDVSEINMHKCPSCTYETKRKRDLNSHILVHKDVSYKCSLCTYEAKHKSGLKNHVLIHKDVSEIEMYKCSLCPYEAMYKKNIISHMLVHKDVSEIKMHKCSLCAYEAKRKRSLKMHMLRHSKVAVTRMHKCYLCGYGAKLKGGLTKHMSVHNKKTLDT